MSKIVIIQGHPNPEGNRLCHALAQSYFEGADSAGHKVEIIDVAQLDFPLLRSQEEWNSGLEGTPPNLRDAQSACSGADHLVLIYPLWLGTMPALLKGFIEQIFRPGVAISYRGGFPQGLFKGKSARIIITMGMPALIYRRFFFAHSLRSLERNILKLVGIKPIRNTIFGMVEKANDAKRQQWLAKVRAFGERAV